MALDAKALVSVQTAKDFLVLSGTADDLLVEAAINRASDACEAWCQRAFMQRTLTDLRVMGPSGNVLPLRAVPVKTDAAVTVSVDEAVQTVWRTEADGDPAGFDVMVASFYPEGGRGPDHLYRAQGWAAAGWTWARQPYNVRLTYTGGYVTAPDDVQQACLYVVQKLFRDAKRQLAEVTSISGPFGSVSILDNAMPRMAVMLLEAYRMPEGV